MKTLYRFSGALALSLILLLSSPRLDAQSTARVALVEQVTSASCGPCASQNPAFRSLLNNNLERVAVIKYQRGGGAYLDPMWSFNPGQVDSRITGYYGTFSFPQAWINGTYYGLPASINQATIDSELAEPAWWDIQIEQSLNEAQDEMSIRVVFKALRDFTESPDNQLRGMVVLIEDEVNYPSPPGYNSERDFFWVMRQMFPGTNGALLGQTFAGEEKVMEYTYPIDKTELDPERLRVVAFVQTLTSKEVHQAAVYREALPSGLNNPENLSELSLHPTLADRLITLSFALNQAETLQLSLYDASGRLVEDWGSALYAPGEHQRSLVLGELPAGVYYATLNGPSGSRVARFAVSR
jgi:hypothetical protein